MRKKYPDAILLPVLGKNMLPLALAQVIGLPIWENVYVLRSLSRKSLCAAQRLLQKPVFAGWIKKDMAYILDDDVVTQGRTIAAIRKLFLIRGGKVVAVTDLAYSIGSHTIAPIMRNVFRLMIKFGVALFFCLSTLVSPQRFEN